jgi:RNA polymerase sigma factor (sigma-70 family)
MSDTNEQLFQDHLGLADVIALEYSNIPRANTNDAMSEARQALLRAADCFDTRKGDFTPFAARAIRNALNSLYAKQLRLSQLFPKSLDEPPNWSLASQSESSATRQCLSVSDSRQDVRKEVRLRETTAVMAEVMNVLSPREFLVIEAIRQGKSLTEIGKAMEISKQAVHKISAPALVKLREKLSTLGYRGLDSQGLLKSSATGPKRRLG